MRWFPVFLSLGMVCSSAPLATQAQTRIPKYIADVRTLEAQQQYTKALVILDGVLKNRPNDLAALWWHTRQLAFLDKVDGMLEDCNRLIKADPKAEKFPHIYTYRAMVYQNMDETAKAMQDLDKSKLLGQMDGHYRVCRFECLQTLGKLDEAISELDQIVESKPPILDHWLSKRANLLEATNRPDKALADWNKAIELNPKKPGHWASRARLLEHLHRYDEAIADYSHLLKLDPSEETIYFKRGKLYLATGKYKLALADLDQSISLDPMPSATAYECRAQIYDKLGDSAKAKKDRVTATKIR